MASLSWIGPERPCGKVHFYKIVLSSPKTIQNKIDEITLNVKVCGTAQYVSLLYYCMYGSASMKRQLVFIPSQNNASAENMTLLVRTEIVAHVRDDDVFNFSVRLHAGRICTYVDG